MMNAEEMAERRADTIYCLAGYMVYCECRVRNSWREYRNALKADWLVDSYRKIVRSGVADLRMARRVFKEY